MAFPISLLILRDLLLPLVLAFLQAALHTTLLWSKKGMAQGSCCDFYLRCCCFSRCFYETQMLCHGLFPGLPCHGPFPSFLCLSSFLCHDLFPSLPCFCLFPSCPCLCLFPGVPCHGLLLLLEALDPSMQLKLEPIRKAADISGHVCFLSWCVCVCLSCQADKLAAAQIFPFA